MSVMPAACENLNRNSACCYWRLFGRFQETQGVVTVTPILIKRNMV